MTPLRFEAEITPGMAPAQVAELATEVERTGFDRLGISDVILWHDCWVLMALCASPFASPTTATWRGAA